MAVELKQPWPDPDNWPLDDGFYAWYGRGEDVLGKGPWEPHFLFRVHDGDIFNLNPEEHPGGAKYEHMDFVKMSTEGEEDNLVGVDMRDLVKLMKLSKEEALAIQKHLEKQYQEAEPKLGDYVFFHADPPGEEPGIETLKTFAYSKIVERYGIGDEAYVIVRVLGIKIDIPDWVVDQTIHPVTEYSPKDFYEFSDPFLRKLEERRKTRKYNIDFETVLPRVGDIQLGGIYAMEEDQELMWGTRDLDVYDVRYIRRRKLEWIHLPL